MRSVNEVTLVGCLGKDPEVSYTPRGTAVAKLSIATSESFKAKDSENWEERTEWHRVTVWAQKAEACSQFLKKGRQVFVRGKLHTESWEKNGEKHYRLDIIASEVIFLGSGNGNGAGKGTAPAADSDVPF